MRARWLLLTALLPGLTSMSFAQQWFSVQTDHLIGYSDGNERGARDAALRGEQIIAIYGQIFHRKDMTFATPLRVLALHAAGPAKGAPYPALLRTPVANFVIADPSQPDAWTQLASSIASLTLEDNYPRAQPWFDSGIVSYLAGIRFTGAQMEVGGPPPRMVLPRSGEWIPLAKLFETNELSHLSVTERGTFEAESWAVVRWLIDNNRLAQAGVYLNAVQSRGTAPEQALMEAFSMGSADLEREVRESLGKVAVKTLPAPRIEFSLLTSHKVATADAHVIQASLSLFGPEADRTLEELVVFMRRNQENAAVHRSLAWAFLLRNDLENAVEHIRRGLALDESDPTMHYLYARWINQGEENRILGKSAEARMGTELKTALKLDPNYAAAMELLGLAELSDDAVKPALERLQRASALRPRNSRYYLNLARGYEAAGHLDAARNLLLYARAGGDAAVSTEAGESLSELGKEKKRQKQWETAGRNRDSQTDANVKHSKYENLQEAIEEDEKAAAKSANPAAAQDMRKIEYLKGRVVSVDCGSGPGATLTVSSGGYTWQMHVADRNAIVLIGVDHFDCGWRNASVSLNFKRSGKLQGDLISLEAN
jgi:tetratricopeptide (TPR) repeat protein